MNKKLITLAVAAAMVAPLAAVAETTLYGRIDVSINNDDVDSISVNGAGVSTKEQTDDGWDMRNETTRIGVKGSEDLGNGLKAIFQAEWAFEGVEGGSYAAEPDQSVFRNRLAYAGLSGGWGTAALGRQWSPYYGAVNKTDVYNKGQINPQYLGTSRIGNALSYVSPNWNGFSVAGALQIDEVNNVDVTDDQKGIDHWQIAGNYNNGPFSVGVAYLEQPKAGGSSATDPDPDLTDACTDFAAAYGEDAVKASGLDCGSDATSANAKYKMVGVGASYTFQEMFKITGQYESGSLPIGTTGDDFDASEWTILGEAYWGNNIFRASYADYGKDIDDLDDFWALGWQYNFSNRTRVYAEYFNGTAFDRSEITMDDDGIGYKVDDGDSFGIGVRHDF